MFLLNFRANPSCFCSTFLTEWLLQLLVQKLLNWVHFGSPKGVGRIFLGSPVSQVGRRCGGCMLPVLSSLRTLRTWVRHHGPSPTSWRREDRQMMWEWTWMDIKNMDIFEIEVWSWYILIYLDISWCRFFLIFHGHTWPLPEDGHLATSTARSNHPELKIRQGLA